MAALSAEDGRAWTERSEHWLQQSRRPNHSRALRKRRTEPLILCGHGVGLRVERGTLSIRNGFTHYPQEREEYRYFKGDLKLPNRIIMIGGSGGVSFEVLGWLSEQGVTLAQLDWRGKLVSVVGAFGYAADATKVAWQKATRTDPSKRLAFSTGLVLKKVEASLATVRSTLPQSAKADRAIAQLEADASELRSGTVSDIAALRGVEGRSARAYFVAWHGAPLAWKAAAKHPIPDEWRRVGPRSALRTDKSPKNERATHPLNAMLNYAYAVLQSQLQIKTVAEGYDPTLGIMHHGYRGSPAYIFDLMEPERPNVDRAILQLAFTETFSGADFAIRSDGTCRLSPQLARRIVQITSEACLVRG